MAGARRLGCAIGAAGKTLKVNASANGLEYGSGGGVLGMNQYITADQFNVNPSGSDWAALRAAHKVDYTAKSTTSHFLLESFISQGMDSSSIQSEGSGQEAQIFRNKHNICFKLSLAWILPIIPATGPIMPSASQFNISSDGID